MDNWVMEVILARTGTEDDEDYGIDDDGAEHQDEDPEVVQPKTFRLEFGVDPALKRSAGE
jgi:hypothetical protein